AGGRTKAGIAGRLGSFFGRRALPYREACRDRLLPLGRQRRGGHVPTLLDPGHRLAVCRIDKAMAELQPALKPDRRALDMKAAAGAQFARETDIEMARKPGAAEQVAEAQRFGEIRLGLVEPVEIIGDREMLG